MSAMEQETGITYADCGIDMSHARGSGPWVQVRCPKCQDQRTHAENRKRQDLSVNVEDGNWHCQHCQWSWGLKGEAAKRRGDDGSTRRMAPAIRSNATKPATKPLHIAAPVAISELPAGLEPWAVDWFRNRGISEHTATIFGISSTEWKDDAGNVQQSINFPYRVDGKLVNVKRRRITAEGGKAFKLVANAGKSLYNVDAAEGQDTVVFVEGEPDCLACHEVGWIAVTVPTGAPGKHVNSETGEITVADIGAKLDACFETKSAAVLAAAKRIVIAVDGDPEGQKLRDGLVDHLGPERCWLVSWPEGCKDSNDVLINLGPEALDNVLVTARPVDLPGITNFESEFPALVEIWKSGYEQGYSTGWPQFDKLFKVVPGSLITISGIPGNGKTSWVLSLFANLAHLHDMRFGVFSPEAGSNGTLLGKLVQLVSDRPILPGTAGHISFEELEAAASWVNDRFWRIDSAAAGESEYGTVSVPEIIKRLEMLVLRHGISGAIVDPWNRLEALRPNGMDGTEYVAWALNQFSRFAKRHNIALFLICHPRKLDGAKFGGEEPIPSPYEISGSSHWYNMSDYVLGIGRNKFSEPKNRATVEVQKVREEGVAGELGTCHFYYDGRSRRFVDDEFSIPMMAGSRPFMPPPRFAPQDAPVT